MTDNANKAEGLTEGDLLRLNEMMEMPYWRDDDSQRVRPIILKLVNALAKSNRLPDPLPFHPWRWSLPMRSWSAWRRNPALRAGTDQLSFAASGLGVDDGLDGVQQDSARLRSNFDAWSAALSPTPVSEG